MSRIHLIQFISYSDSELDYVEIYRRKVVLDLIPAEKAYHYEVLPIDRKGRFLSVAMVDPTDISAIEDLRFITSMEINHPMINNTAPIKKTTLYPHLEAMKPLAP